MHRLIRDHLEEVLSDKLANGHAANEHMAQCEACRGEVALLREQSSQLRSLRPTGDAAEPRPGFYARVMERIEAQRPSSIWNLFFDSVFGRRMALASLALALLMGIYLVSTERMAEPQMAANQEEEILLEPFFVQGLPQAEPAAMPLETLPGTAVVLDDPAQDDVLANLVTYREQ